MTSGTRVAWPPECVGGVDWGGWERYDFCQRLMYFGTHGRSSMSFMAWPLPLPMPNEWPGRQQGEEIVGSSINGEGVETGSYRRPLLELSLQGNAAEYRLSL